MGLGELCDAGLITINLLRLLWCIIFSPDAESSQQYVNGIQSVALLKLLTVTRS
jgi:hypothetical protein